MATALIFGMTTNAYVASHMVGVTVNCTGASGQIRVQKMVHVSTWEQLRSMNVSYNKR